MHLSRTALVLLAAFCLAGPAPAGGLVNPDEAPEWKVSEWINGDPGTLASQKGRVVVLHFFQVWCPGSNNFSLPLVQRWDELWGERDDFLTVSIHSVFEGHEHQTPGRLREFLLDAGIWHPVGIDAYNNKGENVPITMKRYNALGTPQVAVIDKEGQLVFSHFGRFDIAPVEYMLERLLKYPTEHKPRAKPEAGRDSVRSGRYKLHFEQTAKSCGALRKPYDTNVNVIVSRDRIQAVFKYNLEGISELIARYDPRAKGFDATASKDSNTRGYLSTSEVTITGRFIEGSRPPRLEYEAIFSRRGEQPEQDCEIEARGYAVRIGE